MIIVLTGVPGTGKTAIAQLLAKSLKPKHQLVSLNDLVKKHKLYSAIDPSDNSKIVHLPGLKSAINTMTVTVTNMLIEGHLACEFCIPEADLVLVLRTNPNELRERLGKRKYPKHKLNENVMAEALDYCLLLSQKNYPEKIVFELDTTGKSAVQSAKEAQKLITAKKKPKKKFVNWSEQLFSLTVPLQLHKKENKK
ncbi:Putative adenylate kinase [Candidatus Gugararchaeum adminiculabundum]|nr:Putative adenylate kinase [Candidatus Gugararchaeum adminiculabundum]